MTVGQLYCLPSIFRYRVAVDMSCESVLNDMQQLQHAPQYCVLVLRDASQLHMQQQPAGMPTMPAGATSYSGDKACYIACLPTQRTAVCFSGRNLLTDVESWSHYHVVITTLINCPFAAYATNRSQIGHVSTHNSCNTAHTCKSTIPDSISLALTSFRMSVVPVQSGISSSLPAVLCTSAQIIYDAEFLPPSGSRLIMLIQQDAR
jgi:hypothetical protein